jgi:hypothetical protein
MPDPTPAQIETAKAEDDCIVQLCGFFRENTPPEGDARVCLERIIYRFARRLNASRPALEPGWRPIESAPKDRSIILLGGAGWRTTGWYDDTRGEWYQMGEHWTDSHGGPLPSPTYWLPLPAPPAELARHEAAR